VEARLTREQERVRRTALAELDVEPNPYREISPEEPQVEQVPGASVRQDPGRRNEIPPKRRSAGQEHHSGHDVAADEGAWEVAGESLVTTRDEIRQRYAGLGEEPTGAHAHKAGARSHRAPRDPGRLASPRRPDVLAKRIQPFADEDALLAEIAERYSRAYGGRAGWSPGAMLDSLLYAGRLARRHAGKPLALRRLRQTRAARVRLRQDQLSELGEIALALRDLDTPLLDTYRERLLDLHKEEELREDEIDALNQRIEEARRDFARATRQHQTEAEALDAAIREAEEALRPAEAEHRAALKTARAALEDTRALEQQIDRARAELHRLSKTPGQGDETARLEARMERWTAERDTLVRELPRLEAKAADMEPELSRLRKERDRRRQALRDHREAGMQAEAEHKRERSRLRAEVERIRVAVEQLAADRRALYLECGRQLDIDRPDHDHLEEVYREIDATAAEIRRIDQEMEIAQSSPGQPDWAALGRAAAVLGGLLLIIVLIAATAS